MSDMILEVVNTKVGEQGFDNKTIDYLTNIILDMAQKMNFDEKLFSGLTRMGYPIDIKNTDDLKGALKGIEGLDNLEKIYNKIVDKESKFIQKEVDLGDIFTPFRGPPPSRKKTEPREEDILGISKEGEIKNAGSKQKQRDLSNLNEIKTFFEKLKSGDKNARKDIEKNVRIFIDIAYRYLPMEQSKDKTIREGIRAVSTGDLEDAENIIYTLEQVITGKAKPKEQTPAPRKASTPKAQTPPRKASVVLSSPADFNFKLSSAVANIKNTKKISKDEVNLIAEIQQIFVEPDKSIDEIKQGLIDYLQSSPPLDEVLEQIDNLQNTLIKIQTSNPKKYTEPITIRPPGEPISKAEPQPASPDFTPQETIDILNSIAVKLLENKMLSPTELNRLTMFLHKYYKKKSSIEAYRNELSKLSMGNNYDREILVQDINEVIDKNKKLLAPPRKGSSPKAEAKIDENPISLIERIEKGENTEDLVKSVEVYLNKYAKLMGLDVPSDIVNKPQSLILEIRKTIIPNDADERFKLIMGNIQGSFVDDFDYSKLSIEDKTIVSRKFEEIRNKLNLSPPLNEIQIDNLLSTGKGRRDLSDQLGFRPGTTQYVEKLRQEFFQMSEKELEKKLESIIKTYPASGSPIFSIMLQGLEPIIYNKVPKGKKDVKNKLYKNFVKFVVLNSYNSEGRLDDKEKNKIGKADAKELESYYMLQANIKKAPKGAGSRKNFRGGNIQNRLYKEKINYGSGRRYIEI
jgi:hypothetical protein